MAGNHWQPLPDQQQQHSCEQQLENNQDNFQNGDTGQELNEQLIQQEANHVSEETGRHPKESEPRIAHRSLLLESIGDEHNSAATSVQGYETRQSELAGNSQIDMTTNNRTIQVSGCPDDGGQSSQGPSGHELEHGRNQNNSQEQPQHHNSNGTNRRYNRIDMALLQAPPPGTEEQASPEVVDELIVPILPVPMAIACCLMNFAFPGLGTMVAGMCVPCCGDTEEMSHRRKLYSCMAVFGVGVLQLILTACFLVGWVWSAIWGLSLVGTSLDYYEKPHEVSSWRNRVNSARASSDNTCSCFTRPFGSGRRRPRSNFIYPMRAPSDIDRDSPPPPYVMFATPPPAYGPPAPINAFNTFGEQEHQDLRELGPSALNTAPSRCAVCQKDFVTEEHRFACRRCTDIVCRQCYTKRLPLEGENIIVCDVCYSESLEMNSEMECL